MVAIVGGMRSGLELGSLQVLGLRENVGGALQGRNGQAVFVNVTQGQVVVQDEDDLRAARGPDASLARTYNSNGSWNDDNGDGWTSGVSLLRLTGTLNAAGSTLQRVAADGSAATYEFDASRGLYVSTEGAGAYDTLAYVSADAQFEWRDGATGVAQRYEGAGSLRLLSSRDTSGNAVTYAYGTNGFLASVTTAGGETVWYDYAGNNLSQVRTTTGGATTTTVRYGYDTSNRLVAVTVDLSPADNSIADGKVYQTTYTYDGTSKRVASIAQTDGTKVLFTYVDTGGGAYKVATVRDALGQTTTFTYGVRFTTVTDALGFATRYDYDDASQLTAITGPAVAGSAATRQFAYDAKGNVLSTTDGEGRATSFQYDERGNQVLQRDAAGNTIVRTFDAANQQLTETRYTEPDPDAAGPATPTGPLVARQVYDAAGRNLLRFSVSAEGRVVEYRYNGFGQRVAEITHAALTYPSTGSAPDSMFTESALATWIAGQNLMGSRRVDYGYDARGLIQTRTTYSVVGAGGEGLLDGTQTVERYVYDAAGRLLQTVSPSGATTTYTRDALGRTLTATNALGQVTVTQYDDAGRKTLVTAANGLVTTTVVDAAGRVASTVESNTSGAALGETRYFYDADNRLRMTQDPTGVRRWVLYDAAGRKAAEIDGNGSMTEYAYDRRDLVISSTTWGTAVNTTLLVDAAGLPVLSATVAALRPAESGGDAGVWRQYDNAGRLVREATSTGTGAIASVTELRYDGASRLVKTVRYANTISTTSASGNVGNGIVVLPPASPQDRVTRHFYDADDRLTGTLDAEGYLVTFKYNAAGQLIERLAYATATSQAARAAGTLAQLLPLPVTVSDVRERTFYDARGRVATQVDGEGYATETVYDANGNATRTIRYATPLPDNLNPTPGAPVRPGPSPSDRSSLRSFDALNRIVQETSPEGVVTQYGYDAAGNLDSTVRAAGTGEVQTLLARYDVQGRLSGEISSEGAALLTGGQTQAQLDAIWAQYGTAHAYDAASRRVSSMDAAGNRTLFFYDADGAVTHTVNALGEVQESRYDARGRVVETIAYAGRMATTGLVGGLVTTAFMNSVAALANGAIDGRTFLTYTRDGMVATSTEVDGAAVASGYNAFGDEVSRQTTGVGVNLSETYTADRRGLRTGAVQDAAGINAAVSTIFDAFGRVVQSTDANGNVREQVYDRAGRVVVWKDPTSATRRSTYDAFDRVLTQTDALGNTTRYAYDATARSLQVTTAEGIVTTTFYTRHGQVERFVDGKGQSTSYFYDRNGNLVRTQQPIGATSTVYDNAGRAIETTDANGAKVTFTYDAANRVLTRRVDPSGLNLTTAWQYDGKGQRVSVTDPLGVVTTLAYDRRGRVLKQTVDPAGLNLQTVSTFDARGNVLTVRSPGGTVTEYVYDALGRRTQERVDPAGLNLQRSWTYDRNGNAISSTDARGFVTRYSYDASDRLVFTVDPLGNVRHSAHDAAGRVVKTVAYVSPVLLSSLPAVPSVAQIQAVVTSQPAQDVVEHRVYDRDGRLSATVDGIGAVVRYGYDANGNVVSRTAHAIRISLASWTPGTQPVPIQNPTLDVSVRTVYDGLNRAIYSIDGMGAVVARSYDNAGNLLQRTAYATAVPVGTAASASALSAAVALVANASRDGLERNTYDATGRLTWTVDGTGAVTQRVYDGNGNVVRRVDYASSIAAGANASAVPAAAGDRATTFAYDTANRLVFQVDALRGVTEQVYDAEGNVTRRTAYATPMTTVPAAGLPGTMAAIRSALEVNAATDRSTRYAWDAARRQVMVVDAVGAVTENQFDGAGNLLATVAYANSIDAAGLPLNATAAQFKALVQPNATADRWSRHAYDAAGQQVYTVDAAGAVRANQFDGTGRMLRTTRYARPLADPSVATTMAAIAVAIAPDPGKDQVDTFSYDAAGNILSATDALGATETFGYDALGNKVIFTNKKGASWTYNYDAAGRLVTEVSPLVSLSLAVVDPATGKLKPTTADDRVITQLAYDALGNLVLRTEASGRTEQRTTRYEYDPLGRQVRVIHPEVGVYDDAADGVTTNGATGLASRVEKSRSLDTQTFYDALGNAVANRDVGGAISQKGYDLLGRVVYEVDALGYVTGYTRNAFGDVTSLVRFGAATSLAGSTITQATQAASRAQVDAALAAPGVEHSRDRALLSSYDRMGRLVEKVEPTAFVYDSSATGNTPQYETAGRKTQNVYDAFGQLVQTKVLRNQQANTWAATTHSYDRAGRETRTVDALGYVTARQFDAFGNLAVSTEYALALPSTQWTVGGALPLTNLDDRTTTYAYDRLNRKVGETRVQVEFSTAANGSSARGNLVTVFGFDAVGNQTVVIDAAGKSTYTNYDALGRVTAIAAPDRPGVVAGTTLTPLTTFLRDAYGNVVVTLEHARGAMVANGEMSVSAGTDVNDRQTVSAFDSFGHATQVADALGNSTYFSYDAWGHAAKQWRAVTGNDLVTRTSFEVSVYDKLGRLIETRTPASTSVYQAGVGQYLVTQAQAGLVVASSEYNAFGEVTRKGTQGGWQEYFDYDNGGRLWRTNSGDGVDRIQLYDLQGNVTAEIRSAGTALGNVDFKALANAEAAAMHPSTRRIDLQVDLLGRVTGKTDAARLESQGGVVVQHQYVTASAQANPGSSFFKRVNTATLTWNSLSALGSGDLRVTVEYRTLSTQDASGTILGELRSYTSGVLVGDANASGTTLAWEVGLSDMVEVGSVSRVVVEKKDKWGSWQTVIDQGPGHGRNSAVLQAPSDPNASTQLEMRVAGSTGDTGWVKVGLVNFGAGLRYDASALAPGSYEYRVSVKGANEATFRVTATGTVAITQPSLSAIGGVQYGQYNVPVGYLTWPSPAASISQVFRYRLNGSTGAWSALAVAAPPGVKIFTAPAANTSGVNTVTLAPGTYQFELLWTIDGQSAPTSHAIGTFTVVPPVPSVWVPPLNLPQITGVAVGTGVYGGTYWGLDGFGVPQYSGGTKVNALTWPAVDANVAQYRVSGGTWTNFLLDNREQLTNESGPTGTQKALLYGIPPGTYEVRIWVGNPATKQATATLKISADTPGYWKTSYVQVKVYTPVYTPLYDEAGKIVGYELTGWTVSYQTQAKQEWIPPVPVAPTLTITTPPYTPGYWTQAVPTTYALSVTTPVASAAISTTDGANIGQSPTLNSSSRWLRPFVEQKVDRWGNVTEITDPRASSWKTTYRYNANNQLVQQVLPDAGLGVGSTTLYYDALGRQVATRDARGNVNGQVYDAGGNLVEEKHADGGVVRNTYNAFGDKVGSVDAMGKGVTYTYDKLSRLLQVDKGMASVWQPGGSTATVVGTRMISESWTYDQLGRRLQQVNGNGERLKYTYDLSGNLIATQQPLQQVVRAAYDAQGRKIAEVDANGVAASWTYDYFGRLMGHYDMGGSIYVYAYDNARQLIQQASGRSQKISYGYDAAGQLTTITDETYRKTTSYVYDLAGRKLRERVVQDGIVYQDNQIAYDARGNLRDVTDGRAHVTMEYDQVGNRTRVTTHVDYQGVAGEQEVSTNRYFRYDEMNRQVVVDAVDQAGNIGQQGHRIAYDKNGNRTSDTFWGTRVTASDGSTITSFDQYGTGVWSNIGASFTSTPGEVIEQYRYDGLNRLESVLRDGVQIDIRRYDAADRVVQSGPGQYLPLKYVEKINEGLPPGQLNGKESRINTYDANGRLLHQQVLGSDNKLRADIDWRAGVPTLAWEFSYTPRGYDNAGNVLGYTFVDYAAGAVNVYSTELARYEGYQATVTQGQSSKLLPGSSTQGYDANGFLTSVTDSTQPGNNRTFVNDANGRALYVNQGGRIQRQMIVNGEVLGLYGAGVDPNRPATGYDNVPNFTNVADFNFSYAPISASYPTPSPGAYTIRTGDTLQSIAQGAYGDSSLWFRVAEANGLASSSDLKVGQTLNIPNRVSTINNNAGTFQPYDPSRIEGDKAPSLAMPKPKKKSGLGNLLAVIVSIVVAAFTAGVGAILMSGGTLATASMAQIMIAGMGGMSGTFGVGLAAAAGAAGSIAGQLVGVATGAIDEFDWKGVALSALSNGATVGMGGTVANVVSSATQSTVLGVMAQGMTSNAVMQGIGVVTGLRPKFDWREVAASGVGSIIGQGVGKALDDPGIVNRSWGEQVGRRWLAGIAGGAATAAAKGGKVAIQQVAMDAFGNALGQSIASSNSSSGYSEAAFSAQEDARDAAISDLLGVGTAPTRGYTVGQLGSGAFGIGNVDSTLFEQWAPAAPSAPNANESPKQAFRQQELAGQTSVAGTAYRAVAGDSISRILGISDPQAIGNFMRANALTSSTIVAGRNYFLPEDVNEYADSSALGQATLNADKSRLAAIGQQRAALRQALWDSLRDGAWSGRTGDRSAALNVGVSQGVSRAAVDMIPTGGDLYVPAPHANQSQGIFGKAVELLDEFNRSELGRTLQGIPQEGVALGGVKAGLVFLGTTTTNLLGDAGAAQRVLANAAREAPVLEKIGGVVADAEGINPRLQQRLNAWRDYQARGGEYDLQRWVQSTQGAPWATGIQSGYGKWINSLESVHGNSLLSKQPATLYQLYTDEGEFLKWGISQTMNTRYSGTFMADKQIFRYAEGSRAGMLRLEREMVETRGGPLNFEPWAGRRKP